VSAKDRERSKGSLQSRHTRSNSSEMNKTFKTFLRLSGDTGAFAAISGVFSSPYDQPVVVRG
jgi:hypothetical protein